MLEIKVHPDRVAIESDGHEIQSTLPSEATEDSQVSMLLYWLEDQLKGLRDKHIKK